MSAIIGIVTDLLGKLIAPILGFIERWRAERTARELGRQEQGRADAEAGLEQARKANDARSAVGGTDGAVDRMLRRPGDRGGA